MNDSLPRPDSTADPVADQLAPTPAGRHLRVLPQPHEQPDSHAHMTTLAPTSPETPLKRSLTRSTPPTEHRSRSRHENVGGGIRRDHRTNCTSRRCNCPYSYWLPQENGQQRKRATVYGALADARRAKQQAQQAAEQRRRTRLNQRSGVATMPTLNTWFDQLMQREWGQKRISTQERRIVDYDARLREPLGKLRLNQITPQVVEQWLYDLLDREGNRRCVQGAHDTLCALLQVAVRQQLVPANAAKAVRYPHEHMQTKKHRVLTLDEYRKLLAACKDRAERTMIRMLCEAGLRRSELIALQVGDLDLANGFVTVQRRIYVTRDGRTDVDLPKSRKPRVVAINESLASELRWHLMDSGYPPPDAPVWTRCNLYTDYRPEPLTGSSLMKLVQAVGSRAGYTDETEKPWLTPHSLRATGASIVVASGVSPHIAKEQLGHAFLRTTQKHYLHLPATEALKQFGAAFE